MGEYAKFRGDEVKIGTCEWLYYLRWSDRGRVSPLRGNVRPGVDVGLSYRLPIPSEDSETPGGYSSGWAMVDLPGFRFDGADGELHPGPFRLYAVKHHATTDGRPELVPCVTDGRESWSLPEPSGWPDVLRCVEDPALRGRLTTLFLDHGPRGPLDLEEVEPVPAPPPPPATVFPWSGPYPL
jgi:hypothetical protein